MIHDRKAATWMRGGSFLFALMGILAQMGAFRGEGELGSFVYYTMQSNLFALLLFGMLFWVSCRDWKREGRWGSAGYFVRLEMVCLVDILLTMVVYWVLLAPTTFNMGDDYQLLTFENLAVHLVTPLLILLDYMFFTLPKSLRYRDVYAVLIYPLAYVLITSLMGLSGYVFRVGSGGEAVHYPYFFYDYGQQGWMAGVYIIVLLLFLLMLGHVMYWLDQKWRKPVFLQKDL